MFYRSRRSGTNYQKVPTAGLYAEIRYLEKQKAENRQSIRECLQGLRFGEKKRVLRRTDKETLFGFNRSCPLNELKRIPPKHQKILSDMDRLILSWRFMTLFVVKNEFIEARGYYYFGKLRKRNEKN